MGLFRRSTIRGDRSKKKKRVIQIDDPETTLFELCSACAADDEDYLDDNNNSNHSGDTSDDNDNDNNNEYDEEYISLVYETIQKILETKGHLVHAFNEDGYTPLQLVCANPTLMSSSTGGGLRLVKLLVETSEQLAWERESALHQRSGHDGMMALHVACMNAGYHSSIDVVEFLIAHHPTAICISDTRRHNLPLHNACIACTVRSVPLELMLLLVQQWPESVQEVNVDGNLPLHLAVQINSINSKGSRNSRNGKQKKLEQREHQLDIVQYLADYWPDALSIENKSGQTPYQVALMYSSVLVDEQKRRRRRPQHNNAYDDDDDDDDDYDRYDPKVKNPIVAFLQEFEYKKEREAKERKMIGRTSSAPPIQCFEAFKQTSQTPQSTTASSTTTTVETNKISHGVSEMNKDVRNSTSKFGSYEGYDEKYLQSPDQRRGSGRFPSGSGSPSRVMKTKSADGVYMPSMSSIPSSPSLSSHTPPPPPQRRFQRKESISHNNSLTNIASSPSHGESVRHRSGHSSSGGSNSNIGNTCQLPKSPTKSSFHQLGRTESDNSAASRRRNSTDSHDSVLRPRLSSGSLGSFTESAPIHRRSSIDNSCNTSAPKLSSASSEKFTRRNSTTCSESYSKLHYGSVRNNNNSISNLTCQVPPLIDGDSSISIIPPQSPMRRPSLTTSSREFGSKGSDSTPRKPPRRTTDYNDNLQIKRLDDSSSSVSVAALCNDDNDNGTNKEYHLGTLPSSTYGSQILKQDNHQHRSTSKTSEKHGKKSSGLAGTTKTYTESFSNSRSNPTLSANMTADKAAVSDDDDEDGDMITKNVPVSSNLRNRHINSDKSQPVVTNSIKDSVSTASINRKWHAPAIPLKPQDTHKTDDDSDDDDDDDSGDNNESDDDDLDNDSDDSDDTPTKLKDAKSRNYQNVKTTNETLNGSRLHNSNSSQTSADSGRNVNTSGHKQQKQSMQQNAYGTYSANQPSEGGTYQDRNSDHDRQHQSSSEDDEDSSNEVNENKRTLDRNYQGKEFKKSWSGSVRYSSSKPSINRDGTGVVQSSLPLVKEPKHNSNHNQRGHSPPPQVNYNSAKNSNHSKSDVSKSEIFDGAKKNTRDVKIRDEYNESSDDDGEGTSETDEKQEDCTDEEVEDDNFEQIQDDFSNCGQNHDEKIKRHMTNATPLSERNNSKNPWKTSVEPTPVSTTVEVDNDDNKSGNSRTGVVNSNIYNSTDDDDDVKKNDTDGTQSQEVRIRRGVVKIKSGILADDITQNPWKRGTTRVKSMRSLKPRMNSLRFLDALENNAYNDDKKRYSDNVDDDSDAEESVSSYLNTPGLLDQLDSRDTLLRRDGASQDSDSIDKKDESSDDDDNDDDDDDQDVADDYTYIGGESVCYAPPISRVGARATEPRHVTKTADSLNVAKALPSPDNITSVATTESSDQRVLQLEQHHKPNVTTSNDTPNAPPTDVKNLKTLTTNVVKRGAGKVKKFFAGKLLVSKDGTGHEHVPHEEHDVDGNMNYRPSTDSNIERGDSDNDYYDDDDVYTSIQGIGPTMTKSVSSPEMFQDSKRNTSFVSTRTNYTSAEPEKRQTTINYNGSRSKEQTSASEANLQKQSSEKARGVNIQEQYVAPEKSTFAEPTSLSRSSTLPFSAKSASVPSLSSVTISTNKSGHYDVYERKSQGDAVSTSARRRVESNSIPAEPSVDVKVSSSKLKSRHTSVAVVSSSSVDGATVATTISSSSSSSSHKVNQDASENTNDTTNIVNYKSSSRMRTYNRSSSSGTQESHSRSRRSNRDRKEQRAAISLEELTGAEKKRVQIRKGNLKAIGESFDI